MRKSLYWLVTLCLVFLNFRELYLGQWSGLAFYPANSIFVEGYLTTPGQQAQDAHQLVKAAGFEVEKVEKEETPSEEVQSAV